MQMEKPILEVPKSITEATFWKININEWLKFVSADTLVSFSEYFMKYQFYVNFTVYLKIKFHSNFIFKGAAKSY